jgi:hypothetical protein
MATTVNAPLGSRGGHLFFAIVLVAQVLLLSSQVTTERGGTALRAFVVAVFSPFQRGASAAVSSVRNPRSGWRRA